MAPPRAVPGAGRRSRREITAVGFLAAYLFLLFVMPARYVVAGTGALGTPATLLSLLAVVWWLVAAALGQRDYAGPNPVRMALLVYLGVVVLCWTIGKLRVLTPLESSTSDRSILTIFGLAGIALVTMDGVRNLREVEWLLRWLLRCAMVMVLVGLVQFFAGRDIAAILHLPGLEISGDTDEIGLRSSFNRPHGTTLHAIEFGVVSAALLAPAYWYARRSRSTRSYLAVAALALAAMTSLSRSAVLAAIVVAAIVLADAPWRQRATVVVSGVVFVLLAGTIVSGLVGTLRSLFTSADTDPSVQARVNRIPRVWELIAEHPWLGRGYGTYTPEDYFLLDNEIQKTAIESGLIGVAVLVMFIGFVALMGWRVRFGNPAAGAIGAALAATILGLFVSSYTFDAFFYRILTGVLYLSIGLVGATYRLTADDRARADRLATSTPQFDSEVAAVTR